VVITVISVRMVEVTIYKIVNVISVRNLFMTTIWAMYMIGFMARTMMLRSAFIGVLH
jgi:hypothetical protein